MTELEQSQIKFYVTNYWTINIWFAKKFRRTTTSSGTWLGNEYNRKIYYIEEFSLLSVEAVYVP